MGKGPKGGNKPAPSGQGDKKAASAPAKGDQKTASKESTQKGGKKGGKK